MLKKITAFSNQCHTKLLELEFLPLLAIRLYLAPIFLSAGFNKLNSFQSTVDWFGNTEWGLGLPMPLLMAVLAVSAEIIGGFALLLGLGTRLMSIPLMITMLVAAITVHWQHGWFAIAPSSADTSVAKILNSVNFPGSSASLENSTAVAEKLDAANSILQKHGHYDWLTEAGNFVVLNNGIEFTATYFILLMVLFVFGSGRFVSMDYWIHRLLSKRNAS